MKFLSIVGISIIIMACLAGFMYAYDTALANFSTTKMIIKNDTSIAQPVENSLVLSFDCGKTRTNITIKEPDNKYDKQDVTTAIKNICGQEATNIQNLQGQNLYENNLGNIGFNQQELKEQECTAEAMSYDTKNDKCVKVNDEPTQTLPKE